MKKIVKKIFLPTMLSTTLLVSLTGCKNSEEELSYEDETQVQNEINQMIDEQETETYVDEDTKLAITDEEYERENQKQELANMSYQKYEEFYTNASVTMEDVRVMIDVINGDVEGYTKDQINDSLALVENALLSDNTMQALDNINAIKMGFEPMDKEMRIIKSPKISEMLLDQDSIDNVVSFENLRDELINEIIETSTYSEETKEKITKAAIDQETMEYDTYTGDMDSSLNNEGTEFAITATKLSLCNLVQMVNPSSSFIKDENGNEYQISPRSDVNEQGYIESDILNQIYQIEMQGSEIPEDLILKRADIESRLISTKYLNGKCTLQDQLLTKSGYTDTSMLDLQKQKKALLEQKLENILNENEMFDGYKLTFNM